jgi:methionine-rich copper-binding protein CopC
VLKRALALALAGLMVSIGLPASAHAQLIDAEPKANQVLSSSPTQFKLTFSDTLINLGPTSNWLRVESAQGELVSADAILNGNQLSALPPQALKPGKYQLTWRVLSEDGHPVQGSYQFTVAIQDLALQKRSFTNKAATLIFSQNLALGTKVTVVGPGSKTQKGIFSLKDKQAIFRFSGRPAPGRYVVYYLAKTAQGLILRGSFSVNYK